MSLAFRRNRPPSKKLTFANMTLIDVACPICIGILIEPVSLPCTHLFCLLCFEGSMEKANLTCPMCRKRIGGWLRQAKDRSLVDDRLWNLVQRKFPDRVQAKLRGEDDGVSKLIAEMNRAVQLSNDGEIHEEYLLELRRQEEELRKRQEAEYRASSELIKRLKEEEEQNLKESLTLISKDEEIARKVQEQVKQEEILKAQEREKLQIEDEKLARKFQKEEMKEELPGEQVNVTKQETRQCISSSAYTPVKGPMDAFVCQLKPKNLDGPSTSAESMANERKSTDKFRNTRCQSSKSTDSNDSINSEIRHFKPIRAAPQTPPKKLLGSHLIEPKFVKASPINLSAQYENLESGEIINQISRSLTNDLTKMKIEQTRANMGTSLITFLPECLGIGDGESSAFRGRGCVRKLDASYVKDEEMEPDPKRLCTDIAELHCESVVPDNSYSSYTYIKSDHNVYQNNATKQRNMSFTSSVNSSSNNSPIEICRTEETEDLNIPYSLPMVTSEAECDKSSSKTSIDSGKTSLCEGDASKTRLFSESPNEKFENIKQGTETKYFADKRCHNISVASLKNNNNNCDTNSGAAARDSGVEDDVFLAEQARLELKFRQEREDMQIALELQKQLDLESRKVDRRKGSTRAYELRNLRVETRNKTKNVIAGKRQCTLEETFRSGNQRLVSHSKS